MKNLSLRILAVMMALLMIVGLTACGGGGDTSSDAPSTSESSTPESSTPETSEPETSEPETSEPETSEPETTEPTDNGETTTTKKDDGKTTTTKKDDGKTTTTKKDDGKTTTTTKKSTTTTKASTNKKPTAAKSWAQIKAEIPASAKGKTIRVYDWNKITEVPGMDKVFANFKKETGITAEFVQINYDNYFTKISSEVAAKNAPELVRVQTGARKEMVNLQPMNKATSYDFTDRAWDENVLDAYTFNGNLYAVNMVGSPLYCPYLVFYNQRLIDDYNLDDPYQLWKKGNWTWEKMLDMCAEFLEEVDDDSYSGFTQMAGYEYFHAWGIAPITFDRTTGKFTQNLQNTEFVKAAQSYAKICENDIRDKQLSNVAKFNAGKILFNISMGLATRKGAAYFKSLREQGAVGCVPLPALKKGMDDVQVMGEMQAYGIPKTAKNTDISPYFLRYLLDKTNYDMENFYDCKNAAEVLAYVQKKGAVNSDAGKVISSETTGYATNSLLDEIRGAGVEQVKKVLDTLAPATEAAAKDATKFYAAL